MNVSDLKERKMPLAKKMIMLMVALLCAFQVMAQQGTSIRYDVKGLADGKTYLLSVHGKTYKAVDSVMSHNGLIEFVRKDTLAAGMYRISFDTDLFTDVIINNESIEIENNMDDLFLNLKVKSSRENSIYYAYWKMSRSINDTISLIAAMGDKIYEANGHVLTPDLDSMQRKAGLLNRRLNRTADSLINLSKGMLVQKILLAYRTPDFEAYRRQPGARPYKKRGDFLKDHYFDNVDFTDSRLLCTEVFYVVITDYITTFADPPSDTAYRRASDLIAVKSAVNPEVHEYVLRLLISTFEDSPWEQTFVHLVDLATQENSCNSGTGLKTEQQKASAIKKLKNGLQAPPLVMPDVTGKAIDLYSINAKMTMLMFWSPDCPHCTEAMPLINDIYSQYHPLGFEIYAVSVGSDKAQWTKFISSHEMKWINVSDLKGPESEALLDYNAWTTPVFILLDENHIIKARPYNTEQIRTFLRSFF